MINDDVSTKKIILNYTPDEIKLEGIKDNSKVKDDLLIDSLSYVSLIIDLEKEFKIKLTTSQKLFNDNVDYRAIKEEIQVQRHLLKNKE